jgi:hypothetical protein
MARTKVNSGTDLLTRGPVNGNAVVEDLSNLLRNTMHALGTVYADIETVPAVADYLEKAKLNILDARRAARGENA